MAWVGGFGARPHLMREKTAGMSDKMRACSFL